jgi:hypothetical protein
MASLKDTEQLTQQLENLVKELRTELQNGNVDFEKLISVADELSESADGLAETFTSVNDALMQRLQGVKSGGSSRSRSQSGSQSESSKAGARS